MHTKKKNIFENLIKIFSNSPKGKMDLLEVLKESTGSGYLDSESLKMIEGVFKVSEIQVREIMVPRPHMKVIDISDDINEIVKKVTLSGHSRFPVIDDNKDEIIGVFSRLPEKMSRTSYELTCCGALAISCHVTRM